MVERINAFLDQAVAMVWSYPVVLLCLGGAIWFTLRLRFIQFRAFRHSLELVMGKFDKAGETGHISHFQALAAAVSGTVGLGNIAGVAVAIQMGGPGAVFWMWMIGFFGMAMKYSECGLATHFRGIDERHGEVRGGPMYYIRKGLGERWAGIALFFAACTAIASLGGGNMFQSNQAASALFEYYGVPPVVTGLVMATLVALVILGGITRIGTVASAVVPFMCGVYVLGALYICLTNLGSLPQALGTILKDAFSGHAAAGGAVGTVIVQGVRRAVFSSESGLGSAPMAHSAARTDIPIRQGFVALLEPFLDTLVVCSATAMVIVMSGYYGTESYAPVRVENPQIRRQVSFEAGEGGITWTGWQLAQTSPVPPRGPFADGSRVASWEGGGESRLESPPLRLLQIPTGTAAGGHRVDASGLRFSCAYQGHPARRVEVLDAGGRLLESLAPGREEVKGKLFTLTGCPGPGEWHSHLLLFRDRAPSQELALRFVAEGEGSWAVDRVQVVVPREGIELTIAAFDRFFHGFGKYFVALAVCLFAFSTAITWSYYGETGANYALGHGVVTPFKWLFVVALFIGAVWQLRPVIAFSDLMMALMAVPNSIAVLLLTGTVVKLTEDYFRRLKAGEFHPDRR